MCVGIIVPKGAKWPNIETLIMAEEANSDGGSISWVEGGKVNWVKGITALEIEEIMQKVSPPGLVHFRIATNGGAIPELCHPFPITNEASTKEEGSANAVMIHNGHWGGWKKNLIHLMPNGKALPKGPWSDTRAMAFLASVYTLEFLELIEEKIGYMNGKGVQAKLGNGWSEHEGCYYSNMLWKSKWEKKNVQTYNAQNVYSAHNARKDDEVYGVWENGVYKGHTPIGASYTDHYKSRSEETQRALPEGSGVKEGGVKDTGKYLDKGAGEANEAIKLSIASENDMVQIGFRKF